ncbi:sodium- and chloride-dependent neutral and basic amino acid transporter B(0+)-like isoform X1 [Apostichopus japonicus]|uniref:sodium- and chloride-dependent neutral and basic amino acid transporter B(0+)-like isoform X1 n=2 Tax=Stichopus japonicus TaxID=307972 RepID=UPI003AB3F6B8
MPGDKGTVTLLSSASSSDENPVRGNWGNKLDFILSSLGYAVGLGNVWRFPYLAYDNGGGAFLIPYVVMLLFAGLPLFFMEVSFGQYASEGPISAWKALPMMRGVGFGMMFVSLYVGIYYNVIITYTIYYLIASLTTKLPWVGCDNSWNTIYCSSRFQECLGVDRKDLDSLGVVNGTSGVVIGNGSCVTVSSLTNSELSGYQITELNGRYDLSRYTDPLHSSRIRSSEEFFKLRMLQEADSVGELGWVSWQLALCLLLAWVIVFLCLIKGVKSSGKVVYVTATFPYIVLLALLILGLTLDGHQEGIRFFITPKWEILGNPQVWLAAAVQIFFSLSAAWGGLITLASYNKFHNNCYVDSLFVAIANCATSIFAGFVIFSIVGFMAKELGKEVDEVVDQGFGLAFIAYPEAVALLPAAPVWSCLFFLMLLTLGLDSQFTIIETIVTAIVDAFPGALRKRKIFVLLGLCCFCYLVGLLCVTRAGIYWVNLMDSYGASFALLIFAICECASISWIYGGKRFINDIRTMIGSQWVDFPLFYWWPINWCIITPALLSFVLLFNWMDWSPPTYNGDYPWWAHLIGWTMVGLSLVWIPGIWVYEFIIGPGGVASRWAAMSSPRESWGPALQKYRQVAWDTHVQHGTTMGGKLEGGLEDNHHAAADPAVEPAVMYKAQANDGYDPPV